jgi:serine/threonine protein kinase
MELMDASVSDLVSSQRGGKPLSEPCIAYILRERLNALVYLHSDHRMHRDIKAANVLLSVNGMVKVSDFGVAAQVGAASGQKRRTFVGSPLWMAPEVIQQSPDLAGISAGSDDQKDSGGNSAEENQVGRKEEKSEQRTSFEDGYDEAADIWSLGITAIETARGEPPRNGVPSFRLLFLIVREPPPSLEGDFSADFKDFVWQCLRKYPKDRPAAIDLLMHPFVAMAEMPQELPQRIKNYMSTTSRHLQAVDSGSHGGGIDKFDDSNKDTAAWDFGIVKSALPGVPTTPAVVAATMATTTTASAGAMLPQREESLSFGTVVRKDPIQEGISSIGIGEEEEPSLNFGSVVHRVPPPPRQEQQLQQPQPPTRLQIPEPPTYGGGDRSFMNHSPALLSGTASTRPQEMASPSGFLLQRPGEQQLSSPAGVGAVGRQSRIAGANGGGPKSKECAIDALSGMIESLNYSKNSPAIDELRAAVTANLEELNNNTSSGGGGNTSSNAVDLGPLGNYLVGQWSS